MDPTVHEGMQMNSVVMYDSRFGNTRLLAQTIGAALRADGPVVVLSVEEPPPASLAGIDLLVVGGPTHAHGMSDPMRRFLRTLSAEPGMASAAFDTRFRMPVLLSGSAARRIAIELRRAGIATVVPRQSFFVTRGEPRLEKGELERARQWAAGLAARVPSRIAA